MERRLLDARRGEASTLPRRAPRKVSFQEARGGSSLSTTLPPPQAAAFLLQGWVRRTLYGAAPPYPCRMDVRSLASALSVMASDTVDVVEGKLQLNEAPPPDLMPEVIDV